MPTERIPSLASRTSGLGSTSDLSTGPDTPTPSSESDLFSLATETYSRLTLETQGATASERLGANALLPDDLSAVLDLARRPSLARSVREQPLPAGIVRLMDIAASSPEKLQHTVLQTGKDPTFLRAAVIFYLEQALWAEPEDTYRALGATPETSQEELNHRVRSLMAWLHPYLGGDVPEAYFADRVLRAWQAIRSPDASAVHHTVLRPLASAEPETRRQDQIRRQRRIAAAAIAGVVAIASLLVSGGHLPLVTASGLAGAAPATTGAGSN